MTEEEKKKQTQFLQLLPFLQKDLRDWYKEQAEFEDQIAGTEKGSGATNIWNASTRLKSIQVVQSMLVVEKHLGFSVPESEMPKLIKEGGYSTFEEMEKDLFPKLEKAFIAGGFPEKTGQEEKASTK